MEIVVGNVKAKLQRIETLSLDQMSYNNNIGQLATGVHAIILKVGLSFVALG